MTVLLLGLILFYLLPWPIALALYIPIVAAYLYLYWRAFRVLRRPSVIGVKAMIGERAKVIELRGDHFEVRYRGEDWRAVSSTPLQPGQLVIIEAVEGLTLQVKPLPQPIGDEFGG
jgi:membrane-bound serine protease (ClpP class)